jgi:predicted hydrocarbon binding protein
MPLKDKFPNQLLFLAFTAAEEILGRNGVNAVFNYAHIARYIGNYPPNTLDLDSPASDFTRFLSGMVEVLGEKGARSVMMQAGLRGFEIMNRDMPGLFNIEGLELQGGSPDKRFDEYVRIESMMVEAGKQIFGEGLHKHYTNEEGWCFEISPCYWCMGLKSTEPICYGEVGFELGLARWVIGKDARVTETHCIARGDPMCRFITHRPA